MPHAASSASARRQDDAMRPIHCTGWYPDDTARTVTDARRGLQVPAAAAPGPAASRARQGGSRWTHIDQLSTLQRRARGHGRPRSGMVRAMSAYPSPLGTPPVVPAALERHDWSLEEVEAL